MEDERKRRRTELQRKRERKDGWKIGAKAKRVRPYGVRSRGTGNNRIE